MISYVERGMRNPTLDTLLRIALALDVDLSRLDQKGIKTSKTLPLVEKLEEVSAGSLDE